MSYYTPPPPSQQNFPRLPEWAPQATVEVSVSTSGNVYINLTITWLKASKTFHFQLSGSEGGAILTPIREPPLNIYGMAQAPAAHAELAPAPWQGGQDVVATNSWSEQNSRSYYTTEKQYDSGSGSGEVRGAASVPRYIAEHEWDPKNQGSLDYDGRHAEERGEGRVGGERMDRKVDVKGRSGKHKVHTSDKKRK